eukprot:276597-Amorphochlora_amoeboformis.AAC.2
MVNWVGFFLAVPLLAVVGNRPHTSSKAFLLYDAKVSFSRHFPPNFRESLFFQNESEEETR